MRLTVRGYVVAIVVCLFVVALEARTGDGHHEHQHHHRQSKKHGHGRHSNQAADNSLHTAAKELEIHTVKIGWLNVPKVVGCRCLHEGAICIRGPDGKPTCVQKHHLKESARLFKRYHEMKEKAEEDLNQVDPPPHHTLQDVPHHDPNHGPHHGPQHAAEGAASLDAPHDLHISVRSQHQAEASKPHPHHQGEASKPHPHQHQAEASKPHPHHQGEASKPHPHHQGEASKPHPHHQGEASKPHPHHQKEASKPHPHHQGEASKPHPHHQGEASKPHPHHLKLKHGKHHASQHASHASPYQPAERTLEDSASDSAVQQTQRMRCDNATLEEMRRRLTGWFHLLHAKDHHRRHGDSQHHRTHRHLSVKKELREAGADGRCRCLRSVMWEFHQLDTDHSRWLSTAEVKVIDNNDMEPCLHPYLLTCDRNRDHRLSHREWCCCFPQKESESPCYARLDELESSKDTEAYIPSCDGEGYYHREQCMGGPSAQTCWCVTPTGAEIPGSRSVGRAHCSKLENVDSGKGKS